MPQIVIDGQLVDEPANITAQRLADQTTAPPTDVCLRAAADWQRLLANGGITIKLPGDVTVLASTDAAGRVDMSGLYTMAKQDTTFSTVWLQSTGAITLNATEIVTVGEAVLKFYQATFAALVSVQTAINAGQLPTVDFVRSSSIWPSTIIDVSSAT